MGSCRVRAEISPLGMNLGASNLSYSNEGGDRGIEGRRGGARGSLSRTQFKPGSVWTTRSTEFDCLGTKIANSNSIRRS